MSAIMALTLTALMLSLAGIYSVMAFTVARRTLEECEHYEPMGDTKEYLKELKKNLPIKDEIYSY